MIPFSVSSPTANVPGPNRQRTFLDLLVLCLLVLLPAVLAGCAASRGSGAATTGRPAPPVGEVETESAESAEDDAPISGSEETGLEEYELEPPGGEWLVDENGYEYHALEVERQPYYTISNGRVMLPPGASYELLDVGDETLTVKIYNPASLRSKSPEVRRKDPSTALADLEELVTPRADRLAFSALDQGLPKRGQWRQGFEIVDMNGDGFLDIVHGPPRKGDGKPKIFLGDGAGVWSLWREARFEGPGLDYGDLAVADFDGDGNLDFALAVHLRGVVVMRGDGKGTFRSWGRGLPYWTPGGDEIPPYSSRTLEVVDWNGDGLPDLLTLGEGPRLMRSGSGSAPQVALGERGAVLFLNRGDGSWERYDQGTGSREIFGDGLAVGDFDGDGIVDFAIASNVKGATELVKLGRGDGSWEDVSLGDLIRPASYGAVHALDLDGDGRSELLLGYMATNPDGSRWTGIDLLALEEEGWRRVPIAAEPEDFRNISALASGDLDGDGEMDLVALTGTGDRWILLGNGDGAFIREESGELAPREAGCQGYAAQIVELEDRARVLIMGFAGEPGSEQIIPGLIKKCPSEGSLEAWKAVPKR